MNYIQEINLTTQGFCDIINITDEIQQAVDNSDIEQGLVCVFAKGSTCSITQIEYEPNLIQDFKDLMERLIPQDKATRHGQTWGDDNGFSHLRASLLGSSVSIPVKDKKLILGSWQQIVFCDFDNRQRQRQVIILVIK